MRNLLANWAPDAKRSASGYYRGLSVLPRGDAFAGTYAGGAQGEAAGAAREGEAGDALEVYTPESCPGTDFQ